jgi:hypothetical protein
MCAVEETWNIYTQAAVDCFEVLEQPDPSPSLVDAAFESARRARENWEQVWEVTA